MIIYVISVCYAATYNHLTKPSFLPAPQIYGPVGVRGNQDVYIRYKHRSALSVVAVHTLVARYLRCDLALGSARVMGSQDKSKPL